MLLNIVVFKSSNFNQRTQQVIVARLNNRVDVFYINKCACQVSSQVAWNFWKSSCSVL